MTQTAPVIMLAARRTPVAPVNGAFRGLGVSELGVPVVAALLADSGVPASAVDQVILGNALYGGGNPARMIALAAGLPETVPAMTIDTQCCAGLDSLRLAAAVIQSGQADVIIAGGVESTSRRPIRQHRPLTADATPVAYERPPFTPWPERDPDMAAAAARLAAEQTISLAAQHEWAIESHRKALASRSRLQNECVPLAGLSMDAAARPLTDRLAQRTPVIADWQDGEHNSGQISVAGTALQADAAALVLMVSGRVARQFAAQRPQVLWEQGLSGGGAADQPPRALVPVVSSLLERTGLSAADFSVVELMEAYAVQAIDNALALGLPLSAINRGGGALARGHPIGASGAILAVRAFHELQHQLQDQRAGARALLAIAAAGGLGSAAILSKH